MAGECTGTPVPCYMYHGLQGLCYTCGCFWDEQYEECTSNPDPCSEHDNEVDCEDCGCTWEVVGTNIKINIGDVWKDVSEIKLNVGDTWKTVTEIWINIGDVWKRIF